MRIVVVIALALTAVASSACAVERLPPPEAPSRDLALARDPPPPTDAGTSRVLLEANGEAARVHEVVEGTPAEGSEGYVGVRPLCTTPCVVELPYGPHPLFFQSTADPSRQSETTIDVGERTKVVRHALGDRSDGGALYTGGATLALLGAIAATTGAILWAAGSAGGADATASASGHPDLESTGYGVTVGGAAAILLGIPMMLVDRPRERPGATTAWDLDHGRETREARPAPRREPRLPTAEPPLPNAPRDAATGDRR